MQTDHLTKKVDHLLEWKRANMLSSNPEYQRGSVWTTPQKKRLVDSVMRGYPIPLIYLHHIRKEVAGAQRDDFEIIDGDEGEEKEPRRLPAACRADVSAVDGHLKKIVGHEAIHLMLLVDRLLDHDQQELAVNLSSALETFRLNVTQDRKARRTDTHQLLIESGFAFPGNSDVPNPPCERSPPHVARFRSRRPVRGEAEPGQS